VGRSPCAASLAQLGYQETINFSFVEERWERELAGNADPIKLLNPIASQMSVMRSSLLGSLIAVLKFNLDRKAQRVRLFELGRVFRKMPSVQDSDTTVAGFDQPMRVAGLAYGGVDSLQWGSTERNVDFFDIKGDVQALLAPLQATFKPAEHPAMHPGRCASVWLGEQLHRPCGRTASEMAPGVRPGRRRRCCLSWPWTPCCSAMCRCSRRSAATSRWSATSPSWSRSR
jgi:phenylalanyl-tRNA synthetase beta subunit